MKKLQDIVKEKDSGLSMERYLRQVLKFTNAQIRSMKFREDGLRVNGERVRVCYIVKTGDMVSLRLEDEQKTSGHLVPSDGKLEILYEDQDLIAVWKESGLVVHPSHGHYQDTLSNRLHSYFQNKGELVIIRSIGRLDRDTSGILVFAKNQVSAARLWKQKEEGTFRKEYLAVCERRNGQSPEQETGRWYTIDAPIGKMDGELMKMCLREDGQRAVTHYQILQQTEHHIRIRVRIDTGRTHQIRVHMASVGYPLVGDVLYNDSVNNREGKQSRFLQLCAWKAELRQPFTEEELRLTGPHLQEEL